MKKAIMIAAVIVSSLMTSGCLVKMALTKDSESCALFTIGKTTDKEVAAVLGKADSVRMSADGKTATYSKGYLTAKAVYNPDNTLKQIDCAQGE
jgi:hypothetical protein